MNLLFLNIKVRRAQLLSDSLDEVRTQTDILGCFSDGGRVQVCQGWFLLKNNSSVTLQVLDLDWSSVMVKKYLNQEPLL